MKSPWSNLDVALHVTVLEYDLLLIFCLFVCFVLIFCLFLFLFLISFSLRKKDIYRYKWNVWHLKVPRSTFLMNERYFLYLYLPFVFQLQGYQWVEWIFAHRNITLLILFIFSIIFLTNIGVVLFSVIIIPSSFLFSEKCCRFKLVHSNVSISQNGISTEKKCHHARFVPTLS